MIGTEQNSEWVYETEVDVAGKRTASQRGLGPAGFKVWQAVNDEYELSQHEAALLKEICRTIDSIDDLQHVIDVEGVIAQRTLNTKGMHPALAEIRAQRLCLAKLTAALQHPSGQLTGVAPAPDKPKRTRNRRTTFQVVQANPGMV
jgi:hypothetical protein